MFIFKKPDVTGLSDEEKKMAQELNDERNHKHENSLKGSLLPLRL